MQGTDLSVQVMGQIKPSLLLLCRPLWVVILCMGGHQTWQRVQINLQELHACSDVRNRHGWLLRALGKHGRKLSCTLAHSM